MFQQGHGQGGQPPHPVLPDPCQAGQADARCPAGVPVPPGAPWPWSRQPVGTAGAGGTGGERSGLGALYGHRGE